MSLDSLAAEICRCKKCRLWMNSKNAVPGEGPADARVMLIGQNPGAEEDKTGRPFVGRSGRFLDSMLRRNEVDRRELFITGVVKHTSPGNRMPKKDEVEACMPYTLKQIELIKPKIIVLMGALAKTLPKQEGIIYVTTVHPAAAMRFEKNKKTFEEDMVKFGELYKASQKTHTF